MTMEEYLNGKRIDAEAFRRKEPALWEQWEQEFVQMNADSFTTRKLYLINPLRRKYPGKEQEREKKEVQSSSRPKVVMPRPKMK